ncbi:MAG: FkbM family methyltransferase [Rhodospirillaceae bacterium]
MHINFSFLDLADVEPLTIVDVGAASLDKADPYHVLAERTASHIIGFEPDHKICAALNAAGKLRHSYFPFAIGAGGPAKLHVTRAGANSSLYAPNADLLKHFTSLADMLVVEQQRHVETHRLDDVVGTKEIDFLKIDVPGGEMDVLKGAARLLPTALAVELEVEFLAMYQGAPLFGDVDAHMRAAGFQLHTFLDVYRPVYTPFSETGARASQTMWADAVYVPDVRHLGRFSRERLLKLAALAHELYGSIDLCAHILSEMRGRGLEAPLDGYLKRCSALRRT